MPNEFLTNILAWFGIILSLVAKFLMAHYRIAAVKLLMIGTAISACWAVYLQDWPSCALHITSLILQARTLKAWLEEMI